MCELGTDSSATAGITKRLGAERVGHLEVKILMIQEKVRSHELWISRVKSEDNRADLLTKFLDPERSYQLFKLLPLSKPGTRCGLANSVALGVVCLLLLVKASAVNQIETVEKFEEMPVAAGWPARV